MRRGSEIGWRSGVLADGGLTAKSDWGEKNLEHRAEPQLLGLRSNESDEVVIAAQQLEMRLKRVRLTRMRRRPNARNTCQDPFDLFSSIFHSVFISCET